MKEFIVRQLFPTVLSLSLSGTLIGIFIAAIHPLTEKYFTKKWNYYIWLLVVARLLLLFHFESDFLKPLNYYAAFARNGNTAQAVSMVPAADQKQHIGQTNPPAQSDTPLSAAEPEVKEAQPYGARFSAADIWTAAAYIWFIGAITAFFIKLVSYRRLKNKIKKDCIRITDNRILTVENAFCAKLHIHLKKTPDIYIGTSVSGPMTVGLRHPIIALPKWFPDQNVPALSDAKQNLTHFQLVLHHELIHVARKDLLYKWIYQLLLCVHWFNPVLYHIGRQINRDCELSCDEAILSELTETGKQIYGNILLDTAEQDIVRGQNAFSIPLLENKKDLKKRLDGILHYRKTSHFRLALSACVFVMILTLSACSTVWISSDAASGSNPGHDSSASQSADSSDTASNPESFHYDDSDDAGAFMQAFSSLVSADSFVENFAGPDRSGDAWNIYDDDEQLAGEDIQDNWGAFNYTNNAGKLLAYGFVLYGSDSFVIAYADRDIDVKVKSSFDIREGNFKLISIAPDKTVTTLNDTGAAATQTITMKKGRNVLKMVGQGAKVSHLEIDYSDLKESAFDTVFYSEDEEYIHLLKDAAVPTDKARVLNALCYLDAKDASELFNTLLTAGTSFTADELCDFLIYSDSELSGRYLSEALKNQTIEPLSAGTVSEIMPYLEADCQAEMLKSLPVEDFYDTFADNIYYLSSSRIEECLTDFIDRGGILTYSMYDDISGYVNESTRQKLDKLIQK